MLYNILLFLVEICLKLIARFNTKLNKGQLGREETFSKIESSIAKTDKTIWFHCASLGEYEQGLPVFECLKKDHPTHKIVLSFFSPSGYEIRKNSPIADVVVYLPIDTRTNAKTFIGLLKPELTVFVKYDIWPNYLLELKRFGLKSILISAALRPNQIYFKWYGGLFRKALKSFHHIFTQDKESLELLKNINYKPVSFAGDTRFDRVTNQLQLNNALEFVDTFKNNQELLVIGSSWGEDELLYLEAINSSENLKIIIAPHEINSKKIEALQHKIKLKTSLYSQLNTTDLKAIDVLIIDTVGLLSKIYSYADLAYVGGAAGHTGLHNILEPATFGIPIFFGVNHKKFPEAKKLIDAGGALEIKSNTEFNQTLNKVLIDHDLKCELGKNASEFVRSRTGATKTICTYLNCK
jgi:3-deoxy-D-manno-octulosonic-acid transferase